MKRNQSFFTYALHIIYIPDSNCSRFSISLLNMCIFVIFVAAFICSNNCMIAMQVSIIVILLLFVRDEQLFQETSLVEFFVNPCNYCI